MVIRYQIFLNFQELGLAPFPAYAILWVLEDPTRRKSMGIFDNMTDEPVVAPTSSGGNFTLQFGTEDVVVDLKEGQTLGEVFNHYSDVLGFQKERALAYRDCENNVLDGTEPVVSGMAYTASLTHDEKG